MRISRNTDCEKGQTQLETFHQKELETVSLEITITTKIPTVQNIEQSIAIAPGEEEKPISILNDFITKKRPIHICPKCGYKVKRDVSLTPHKYFNQRLSNYFHHFFARSVMQKILLNDQISTAMRNITSKSLNAGMLFTNFKAKVQHFISQDKVCSFISSIKGTPTYWENVLFKI